MKCINAVLALPDAQQDRLLERIERLMRMGYPQAEARRSAAQALYDEALAETAEMEQLIREQHPDLFLGTTRRAVDQTETPAFKRWSSLLGPSGMADLVKALRNEAVVNRLQRDAKALSDLLEGQPGLAKGRSLPDIPASVVPHVLGVSDNKEVRRAVVAAIPVDVMNLLASKQLSAEQLLSDKAMLKNVLAIDGAADVSLAIDKAAAASLLRSVAIQAAELANLARGLLKGDSAGFADAGDSVLRTHAKSVTETEAFSRWFGDSKVVDAGGNPLVVYHGAFDDFTEFSKSGDLGYHFGTAAAANDRLHQERKKSRARDGAARVLPVYLSIKNPVTLADQITWSAPSLAKALVDAGAISQEQAQPVIDGTVRQDQGSDPAGVFHAHLVKALEENGYDGVRYRNLVEGTTRGIKGRDLRAILEAVENDYFGKGSNRRFIVRYKDTKYPVGGAGGDTAAAAMASAEAVLKRTKNAFDYSWIAFRPEQIKSAIGNNGQFAPENPDIRYSLPALESELQAINRSLKKVNPASAVAAMTGRAAKVIGAWSDLPPTELAKNLPLPIGPQPHVLHMLGAPMQALQINTSILRKVLLDRGKTASLANQDERDGKHANEFVGVSPEDFIASIYRPMVVMRGNVKGEFEVLLPLLSKQTGQPLMMAFITDAESGKIKSTAIKSSYGDGKLLAELPSAVAASRNGRLLYADLGLMESVMGKKNPAELSQGGVGSLPLGDRAVSTGPSITDPLAVHFGDLARTLDANLSPQASPGGADGRLNTGPRIARPPSDKFTLLMTNIQRAINNRSVLGYGDLINFIASNYTGPGQDMPQFSRSSNQGFELPEFTNMRRVQQNMQDRYNRWKQAVDAVREQGGTITEANDFYAAEERYWGRVGTQVEDFGEEITAFAEAVQKDGLTLQNVAEYVYAKHAKERNAYVARMRDDMEGTGSGMTDEEADAILESARQAGLEAELEEHAKTLYDWIDGTRKVLLDNGLISQEEADSWEGMFENYVPLRGLEGKTQPKGTGGGFRITGKESKAITGRRSQAKQIIEQIIQDRTRALIRSGKNEVLRSFLAFVLDNPSPNLWKVDSVESKPTVVVDEFGNRSVEIRDKAVTDARTVQLKDGGRTIYIEIKDDTLREQMQNLHLDSVSAPVAALLTANRFVGSMLTAYNPAFVMTNAIRDAQTALFGMVEIKGLKGALNLAAQYPRALRESLSAHFGTASSQYREYLLAGGTTGYFGLKDLDQVSKDLQGLVKDAERSALNPIRVGKAIARFVESANGVIEQTTRFAAYLAAREAGDSLAQASKISKNITVNFNRKGAWGNQLSAAILFYNPAVQGSARLVQALRSPKVLGVLGGMASAMFFLALANSQIGGEDEDGVAFWDKVPKETRERNIVFMLPPKRNEQGGLEARFIKIPMAYGYNAFGVAAYEMADQWRRVGDPVRAREPVESALRISQAFIGAVTPAQAIGQALDTPSSLVMLPYSNALGPIAQALANQSGFGRPLYPDNPNERQMPDSQKYSVGQAGTVFQKGAELLNAATGGSKYESGFIDITPGALENAARFYGGGLTSMALDVMNTLYVKQHIERPEPDLRKLPLARNFYGVVDEQSDRWLAYERMKKAEAKIQPLEAAIRNGDGEAIDKMLEDSDLAAAGKALDRTRQQLSKLRKAELQIMQDDTLTDAQKYVRLMEISYETRKVLQNWNGLYDDLLRETSTRRDK